MCGIKHLLGIALAGCCGPAGAATLPMSVRQPMLHDAGRFLAADSVEVDFTLSEQASVTIGLYADRPLGIGRRWYAHEATRVAEFRVEGKQGKQTFAFRLDQIRPPAAPLPGTPEGRVREAPRPGEPGGLPGNYVIEVSDGRSAGHACIHLLPHGGMIPSSRAVPGFLMGAVRDSRGDFIVADRQNWIGRRFSPVWAPLATFPQAGQGHSSNPVECYDVAVHGRDNVYVMTRNGAYKFAPDGQPAAWTADAEHLKCPYPSNTRNVLGVRLDPKERRRYTFGPGGHGAGSKEYGPEDVKRPGFAFSWGGLAVDSSGQVYLGRLEPAPEIQVFDANGAHLRILPLPKSVQPLALRFGKEGMLWVGQDGHLTGLDARTGDVKKEASVGGRLLHVGADGSLFAFSGSRVWRLTPAGEPFPFAVDSPGAREQGRCLDLHPKANRVPEGTGGVTSEIAGLAAAVDGSFYVLTKDTGNPNADAPLRAMRFSSDGRFQLDTPAVTPLPNETGNVFVGDEPAALGLQITNLLPEPARVVLKATVTDLDSRVLATRTEPREVTPLTSASEPFLLDARAMGYYVLDVEARKGDALVAAHRLCGGRVAERSGGFRPYSAFGSVRMEANPELLRRAGGGLNRNHNPAYWNDVEPRSGEWRLQPERALDFYTEHALPAMVILGYGEPWFNGGFSRCRVTSYDAFWSYVATVVRRHRGTAMMWQCWNEPNYFWHVPGPRRYEHYAMVLQGTYAIAKALDPETPVICDGFAGSAAEMASLAKLGAAGFTDGVPVHYPGAKTLAFDNMPVEGTVESKATMVRELAAIRDEHFPGRPLLNTEEGLWGMANRTPRHGAELLPRLYVTQLAAGMDRLTWFECFSKDDPTYLLRGVHGGPWPAYFAYATASQFLEDAQYVGALSDGLGQVHVFAVKGRPLVVAWSVQGERAFALEAGRGELTVTDWQGNARQVAANGKLSLKLGPSVQYVAGCDPALFNSLVGPEQEARAKLLGRPSDEVIGLKELHRAARAAERLALVRGRADRANLRPAQAAVLEAAAAIRRAEQGGGHLRDARVALEIARRMAYFAKIAGEGSDVYAARLSPYILAAANQVERRAATEKPWHPGLMVRIALDTTAVRAKVEPQIEAALREVADRDRREMDLKRLETEAREDPTKRAEAEKLRAIVNADRQKKTEPPPLDEQFPPEVAKKPSEAVEIEMTVYNWTEREVQGTVSPALPAGWKAEPQSFSYGVGPMKFVRFVARTTVPAAAQAGVYAIGARATQGLLEARELHAHRVLVTR